jgi:GT2 family glycosyltransferase
VSATIPSTLRSVPKVTVVILNHNGRRLAERCLSSVVKSSYQNIDIILVDNASTDDSVDHISEHFPDVQILVNTENLGVAGGRNCGFRAAVRRQSDYVLSLDNDTHIHPALIEELVTIAESDAKIGILGPKVYADDGSQTIQCAGGQITYTQNLCSERGAGERDRGQYDRIDEVDYFPGFGFMTRREVFEQLNFLDETFYGYGHEDTDFCIRARQIGYRIVYVPTAIMWHQGSATIGNYSARKKYLEAVNSAYCVRKYGTPRQQAKYFFFAGFGLIYALFVQSLRGNHQAVFAKARGIWEGSLKPLS